MIVSVKKYIAKILNIILSIKIFRWLCLKLVSLKKVAFGEQYKYILYRIPTWLLVDHKNADIICNVEKMEMIDIADNSIDIVYSSHMIEHITDEALNHFLGELHRILKKGGCIRIEAPDAEKLINAYIHNDSDILVDFIDNGVMLAKKYGVNDYGSFHMAFLSSLVSYIKDGCVEPVLVDKSEIDKRINDIDSFVEWCKTLLTDEQKGTHGHINPVYYSKLESNLSDAGFTKICSADNRETNLGVIVEKSIQQIERPHRSYYSFYVEAVK